ncbi:MAG: competence/damage-inducible protein A [Desulfobacteraceae bacterium]|nr:competence/damage-inducible protein A [Desulfobacteraceae bacterium]
MKNANLNDIAATVADVLGMDRKEILVTDAQNEVMTIDILKKSVDAYSIIGQKDRLLRRLAELPGIAITEKTSICSEGMLGWIALEEKGARQALERSEKMAEEIQKKLSKRAIVFSTGFEVESGQIEDTNKPTVAQRLEEEGYSVTIGPTLKDDDVLIAGSIKQSVESGGYGLVVTTGGVGAEAKDQTIEALLALDPDAATPYTCRFQIGTGRHSKDGVRIGVGKVSETLIVALPGPNDEVKLGLEELIKGLKSNLSKHMLAENIAGTLREELQEKMGNPDEPKNI